MIDKYTIDKIHDTAQIVDVVSDFVTLKKRGVNFVGLCPFHDDSKPSFYVSPSKNICKCFACGEGGTSVQFIMKNEKVSYYEALRYLAKKYAIEIKEQELTDEEKQTRSDRESMMIVNNWAQQFFTSRLYEHEEGRTIGLSYFVERGFREDVIRKFQLGYSLNKRDDLYQSALKQGFNESYLLKTGLVYKRDDGRFVDRFHDRVIFPIHSLSGKVVAFGGRIMGKADKTNKYLNSPESEVYHKSYELYGIFFSKQAIVKADKCFFVEGYTDVISMHQTGIENVVATSGTSLTESQIRLIRRFTNNITVLFDGDAAGINAAIRGADMLLKEGMNIKIVLLPDGEDPDSFAQKHNSFDFTLFIKEHEVDFIRFKANLLLKEAGNDPMQRARFIKEIMESIAVIPDNIVRAVYIKECSQLLDEREQVLLDEVIKIRNRKKNEPQREQRSSLPVHPSQHASLTLKESAEITEKDDLSTGGASAVNTENVMNETGDDRISPDTQRTILDNGLKQDKVNDHLSRNKHFPFKKFESALIGYVIRFGERVLFKPKGESNTQSFIKVAAYIRTELANDDIEIQSPVYRQILDEAVANCNDDSFVASQFFLQHTNMEISDVAVNMMSNRYQLSNFFKEKEEVVLRPTNISKEQQDSNVEEQKREKEREQLERWIVQDIFEIKNAYIKHEINEVNKQIRAFQSDSEKGMSLLKRRMELDHIKRLLCKELGDRIVTGTGK